MTEMLPSLDGEDVPLNFPDGSHIPVGLTLLLATQVHITTGEARRCLIEAWRVGQGNRAQRRQRRKQHGK